MNKFILILLFVGQLTMLHSDDTVLNLSLKEATQLAIKSSDEIKIKEINIDKVHQQYIEARAGAFPKIRGEAGLNRYMKIPTMPVLNVNPATGTITGSRDVPLKEDWEMRIGATIEQPIITFGKVGGAIKLAKEAKSAEHLSKDIQIREVAFDIRVMYATVLFAKRIYEISKDSWKNAQLNKDTLYKRFGAGRVSRSDNLKISADVASRLPQVMTAKSNYEQAEKKLKSLLGVKDSTQLNLTESLRTNFEPILLKNLLPNMIKEEPNLKLLQQNVKINSLLAGIQKADYYPSIAGFVSYEYSGNSSDLPVDKDAFSTTAVAGLVLRATIFDAGARGAKYKQAIHNKGIAEINYRKTLKDLELALDSSISEYNTLRETYEANLKALVLAKASYETSLSNFSTGGVTITQLNDAELMLSGTKFNLENTIYSLNILQARIYKLSATPMGDNL